MYTQFIADAKTALNSLWASVEKIHAQQTANERDFRDEIAEERNKRLEADKKAACKAAKERINAICDKADTDAATLDEINPFAVSDDYMKLLSGAFDLTIPQVQHIATECQKSPTMLSAIDAYCKRHEMKLNRATAESRRSGIVSIREGALGLVSRIEATSYKNQGKEYDVPLAVRDFCQDGDFAAATGIYDRIGQRYDGTLVPARVEPESPLQFNFRGVRKADEKKVD